MKKNLFIICLAALPLMAGCADNNVALLNEANKILIENKDSIHTCHDAVVKVGDKLAKIKLSGNNEFAYDSVNKQFVIMNGDNITAKSSGYTPSSDTLDYFKFVTAYNPNSNYSQYLLKEAPAMDALLITTGFDAGTHLDIRNVAYANESRDGRNVIVRAYCDYFSVLAPTQTITHYEDATNVIVTDCAKYNEHGESAYMKAVKGNVYVSNDKSCAVDMFENAEKNSGDVKLTYETDSKLSYVINYDSVSSEKVLKEKSIASASDLKTWMEDSTKPEHFLRLASDIIYDGSVGTLGLIKPNHSVCLDLNGFKLSLSKFGVNPSSGKKEAIRVQSSYDGVSTTYNANLYIIDSQGVLDERSGISLNDCSIVVAGSDKLDGSEKVIPSNFFLNSGKVTQTVTDATQVGAAINVIGQTSTDAEPIEKQANFVMYGGKIACNNESDNHKEVGCIGAAGKGANVNIEFGVLNSDEFCLCGGEDVSDYNLGNAYFNIQGGTLTSTGNACMFFPQITKANIQGGKINGLSCITATAGEINISNTSKLTATGSGEQYSDKTYDGSVIYVPKHNYDKDNLTISVEDSTLTSKYEYIANVKKATKYKTTFNFNSGNYNYMMGDGLLFADPEQAHAPVKKGTWTNTSYK